MTKGKRNIDKEIDKSLGNLRGLKLVSHAFVKKWRILLIAIFIIGFISAVVWMISEKYFPW